MVGRIVHCKLEPLSIAHLFSDLGVDDRRLTTRRIFEVSGDEKGHYWRKVVNFAVHSRKVVSKRNRA
jgi:hypothetical protein